ncbi:MAG: TolC family outer membrane protein [Hyphomicrobiaceae bacterium]|nr:TolC family outer membrane protein [Hyphomicrobiaceae bacterium]
MAVTVARQVPAPARHARRSTRHALACAAVLALLACFCSAGPLAAEDLRQAMRSAYMNNPQLDAERARLRATDENVARAKSGYRPTLRGAADAGYQSTSVKPSSPSSGETSPWGYQLSLSQPIFSGFRTENAVNEAEASVRAGREDLRLVEGRTLLDTVAAYADVVRAMKVVRLSEQNVRVLTRELDAAEARRAVREVTLTDVAQARARRARAVSAADLAKANLKIARSSFLKVVGHPASDLSEPRPPSRLMPRSLVQAVEIASRESPNVVSALYREQAARYAVDKVRGELLPQVSIEARYGERYESSRTLSHESDASITGRISVPLYQGGEVHARVRQAKHQHVGRIQEIEQARAETEANVTAAWSRLVASRAQLRSDEVQVDAARTALRGVREEERVGQRTLLDVLNAEQEYLDAQVSLVQTRRDLVVASYALLASMGQLTAERLQLSNELYDAEAHYLEVADRWIGTSIASDGREVYEPRNRPYRTRGYRDDIDDGTGDERAALSEARDEVEFEDLPPPRPPVHRRPEWRRQTPPPIRDMKAPARVEVPRRSLLRGSIRERLIWPGDK